MYLLDTTTQIFMNPLKDKFFIVYLFEWEGTAIYRKILKQKENKSELS